MAFKDLYHAVQEIGGSISTKDLKVLAIEHSHISAVKEMWSGLVDPEVLRGFYIEGPIGPPESLGPSEALIVLSRAMCSGANGKHWRHFVYTKELMHVFDTDEEKADSEETFDIQIQRLTDPTQGPSPQYRAENKAIWRALMVLCKEKKRIEYREKFKAGDMTVDVLAAALRLPVSFAHLLLTENFEEIANHLLSE